MLVMSYQLLVNSVLVATPLQRRVGVTRLKYDTRAIGRFQV